VEIEDGSGSIGSGLPIRKRRMESIISNGKVGREAEAMRFARQKPSHKIHKSTLCTM